MTFHFIISFDILIELSFFQVGLDDVTETLEGSFEDEVR